jgi:hypothetical protein
VKIRIRGDSVRLRLTKEEVKEIGAGRRVEETTHFMHGSILKYSLEPADVHEVEAAFSDHQIKVRIPHRQSQEWAISETVAIKHEPMIFNPLNSRLFILIEKDFTCLKPRDNENEDEGDMFENPNAAHGSCT